MDIDEIQEDFIFRGKFNFFLRNIEFCIMRFLYFVL